MAHSLTPHKELMLFSASTQDQQRPYVKNLPLFILSPPFFASEVDIQRMKVMSCGYLSGKWATQCCDYSNFLHVIVLVYIQTKCYIKYNKFFSFELL